MSLYSKVTKAPQIDLITLAYMVKGACDNGDRLERVVTEMQTSELTVIQELIDLVHCVDDAFYELEEGSFDACFAYDVAEPAGHWIMEEAHKRGHMPSPGEVLDQARLLTRAHVYEKTQERKVAESQGRQTSSEENSLNAKLNSLVGDPSALMVIVAAAQHPRYIEVMDATGSEVNALRPIIDLALKVDDWCNRLLAQNDGTFSQSPFAPEYMVLEQMGKWIIDRLAAMKDADETSLEGIGNDRELPISFEEALVFARKQVTEATGFPFESPVTYKEPVA